MATSPSAGTLDRINTEKRLLKGVYGFSAAFIAVQYMYSHISKTPKTITIHTLNSLFSLLESARFESQRQCLFLYREVSNTLVRIPMLIHTPLAKTVIPRMQELLFHSKGNKKRAIAQVLGSLPLQFQGPQMPISDHAHFKIRFDQLIQKLRIIHPHTLKWQGRSLVGKVEAKNTIAIIKFAKSKQDLSQLALECQWMQFLAKHPPCSSSRFDVPVPLTIDDKFLINITHMPCELLKNKSLYEPCIAIIFTAPPDYFIYPNELNKTLPNEQIIEIFHRNAWLLGRLTSMGIVHTALIPLFHNRIQQARRNDGGVYLWEQGGRLDKWLDSCQYPNFAVSGLRDFEHLLSVKDTKRLHHFIGAHILSFILVAGSLFRNKFPEKKGIDDHGNPIDARDLFDEHLFFLIVKGVIEQYYHGLTGEPLSHTHYIFYKSLVKDLIDKMGVDEHMEEMLRVDDQKRMSYRAFKDFLTSRGISKEEIETLKKDKEDITLLTGPHLGGFNGRISVPELIEFLFELASRCVADRFLIENGLKPGRN